MFKIYDERYNLVMKDVLFIMKYIIDGKKDNLFIKFTGQINSVEKLGYNVWYTGCTEKEIYLCNKAKKIKIADISKKAKKITDKIEFYNMLYKSLRKFVKNNKINFEFAYIRNMFYCLNSKMLLGTLKKSSTKIIMEIPTYPVKNEIKLNNNLFLRYLLLINNNLSRCYSKYVDLYTIIGENCENKYLGKKAINIENGVQIEKIQKRIPSIIQNEIHILTLSRMAKWHGYDRLIRGLYDYYKNNNNEKVVIHMVGNDGDGSLDQWRKLTSNLELNDFIIFEGYKTGDELNYIVNKCDVAVSSLGIYRNGVYNSSEMKSREYMARGIPFIYATNDEALVNADKYCYRVKNDNSNISINNIIEFVKVTRENKKIVDEMRKYAFYNMSWEKQFLKILKEVNKNI